MNWKPEPQSLLAVRAEGLFGDIHIKLTAPAKYAASENYFLGYFKEYSSRPDKKKKAQEKAGEAGMELPFPLGTQPVLALVFVHQPKFWLVFICERKSYKTMEFIFNSKIFVNQILERIISFDTMGSLGRSFNLPLKS